MCLKTIGLGCARDLTTNQIINFAPVNLSLAQITILLNTSDIFVIGCALQAEVVVCILL